MTGYSTPLNDAEHWDARLGDVLVKKIIDDLSERPIPWKGPSPITVLISTLKYYACAISISLFCFAVYCVFEVGEPITLIFITVLSLMTSIAFLFALFSSSGNVKYGRLYRDVFKRFIDIVVSGILILLLFPMLVAIALLVMMDGGPALYGHLRIGKGGRSFRCLKFRSMALEKDTTSNGGRVIPRVTRIGRWLRAYSLDELPELFNVLLGNMSLVGPRPAVPVEISHLYEEAASDYTSVRPGITGLWRNKDGKKNSYPEDLKINKEYVRQYAENLSIGQDLRILLSTFVYALRNSILPRYDAY